MRAQQHSSETLGTAPKKIQTSSGRDVSALCGGSSNCGAGTFPPGCTEKKLTGAESDTNVKQTLVNVFV